MRCSKASRALLCIALFLGLAATTAEASSITLNFIVLENNSPIDLSGQLSVTISDEDTTGVDLNAGQVSFTFNNSGPLASSITDVYFDDGALLGIASVVNGAGVSFSQGASPPNLSGGAAIDFNTTSGFLADSDAPAQPNGVNPGEWVAIVFNLQAGKTFDDVVAALELAGTNPDTDLEGGLRIGMHVQGLSDGQSETYVTTVPEDGSTLVLLGLGILALGVVRRSF